VFPTLGPMHVTQISTADVVGALKPIWAEKPETANRVRQRIEAVLDYAYALGIREGDNPSTPMPCATASMMVSLRPSKCARWPARLIAMSMIRIMR